MFGRMVDGCLLCGHRQHHVCRGPVGCSTRFVVCGPVWIMHACSTCLFLHLLACTSPAGSWPHACPALPCLARGPSCHRLAQPALPRPADRRDEPSKAFSKGAEARGARHVREFMHARGSHAAQRGQAMDHGPWTMAAGHGHCRITTPFPSIPRLGARAHAKNKTLGCKPAAGAGCGHACMHAQMLPSSSPARCSAAGVAGTAAWTCTIRRGRARLLLSSHLSRAAEQRVAAATERSGQWLLPAAGSSAWRRHHVVQQQQRAACCSRPAAARP